MVASAGSGIVPAGYRKFHMTVFKSSSLKSKRSSALVMPSMARPGKVRAGMPIWVSVVKKAAVVLWAHIVRMCKSGFFCCYCFDLAC